MNGHKINNVTELYNDACKLYNDYVLNADASADKILSTLESGITNLKNYWKGSDAGVQINSVIGIYNSMVALRNALSEIAAESSKVASSYREIQIANSSSLEALSELKFEPRSGMDTYTDTADTINITPEAVNGKNNLDTACSLLETFAGAVSSTYSSIMNNWQSGTGRENAETLYGDFNSKVSEFKQVLEEVSKNISTALSNYGLL